MKDKNIKKIDASQFKIISPEKTELKEVKEEIKEKPIILGVHIWGETFRMGEAYFVQVPSIYIKNGDLKLVHQYNIQFRKASDVCPYLEEEKEEEYQQKEEDCQHQFLDKEKYYKCINCGLRIKKHTVGC